MNALKTIIQMLRRRLQDPVAYSRSLGVTIGEHCKITEVPQWGSEPYLITIGDHTGISSDVIFITHDGATWAFRDLERYKTVHKFGKITVGNRCFLGARCVILPGVTIGDRCVIAAGSVVGRDVPDGQVWGGVPAHFITTTEELAEKLLQKMPRYDPEAMKRDKKGEVLRVLSEERP